MKTILLGPNGQLGSDIRTENGRQGEPLLIRAVDRSILDLTDFEKAKCFLRNQHFDCLINCASYHRTDEVERNAQLAFTINAHLVQTLAEICAEKKARFVHISTDYVFGGQQKRAPLTEADGKAPVNVYGASKGMGEDLATLAGGDPMVLRVASLFGVAGASGKGGNFVETMIRLAKEKGKLSVVADQTMSPTGTADIAEAVIAMVKAGVRGGVWHVVNSGSATWYEFAKRIIDKIGVPASVTPISSAEFPTPAKRPIYSVLDNAKLASNIKPMRPWQDALDAYLIAKGYRERGSP